MPFARIKSAIVSFTAWVTTYGRHACSIKNNLVRFEIFICKAQLEFKMQKYFSVCKAKISRQINDIRDTGPDTENMDHGPDMGFLQNFPHFWVRFLSAVIPHSSLSFELR
jgi:hypothetical protein